MRNWKIILTIAVVALGSFSAGAYYGKDVGGAETRAYLADREIWLRALAIHKALDTLLLVRDDPSLLVADQEGAVLTWVGEINLEAVAPRSMPTPILKEAANRLIEYRSRYPGTELDPAKNAKLQKLLTFAGPSAIPNLMTTPVKK